MKKMVNLMDMERNIALKDVTESDYRFLYDLLKQRDPIANISHKKMPTYEKHVEFILSKPYSKWQIIYYNRRKVGAIYLSTEDEIGIHIKREIPSEKIKKEALRLLMKNNPRKTYLANVTPRNTKLIEFFKKSGFKPIQYTYELNISESK